MKSSPKRKVVRVKAWAIIGKGELVKPFYCPLLVLDYPNLLVKRGEKVVPVTITYKI